MKRLAILVFVLLLAVFVAAEDKFSDMQIQVMKEETNKPVRNAAVVLHVVNSKGKEEGALNLKTDAEGKTSYNGIPYGKLRVQVIARGLKTFGQDFDISE